MAAYMECTKGTQKKEGKKKESSGWGLGRFSCKQGSEVREDGLVKMSDVDRFYGSRKLGFLLVKSRSQGGGNGEGHQRNRS